MVDTIVLILNRNQFKIKNSEKFGPSAKYILNSKRSLGASNFVSAKQNPSQKDLYNGIYKPRLTLTKRKHHAGWVIITLRAEVSLPKLMYGNNFDELTDEDLEALLIKLKNKLNDMGVIVSVDNLRTVKVVSIHYSKNIALTDGRIPYQFINKIKEADISQALDINKTDYRGGGYCFKWHCNSYEVVFYDKIQDLKASKRSEKHAIEGDNAIQLNIFLDTLQKREKLEVLRIEVRLNKQEKIKSIFRQIKIRSELTLSELFKVSIAKKVLQYYMNEIERKIPPTFNYKNDDGKSMLMQLICSHPDLTPNKKLQLFGLISALKVMSQRELKTLLGRNGSRALTKTIDELKRVNLDKRCDHFDPIHQQLAEFKPLKLANFLYVEQALSGENKK